MFIAVANIASETRRDSNNAVVIAHRIAHDGAGVNGAIIPAPRIAANYPHRHLRRVNYVHIPAHIA